MNSLPVLPLLAIKHGIFILWLHLLLARHLRLPALNLVDGRHSVSQQGGLDGINNVIDAAKTAAMAELLGVRESPWTLPNFDRLG